MDVPIIPGFYPDPSICRVGDDYYLASSTFEYKPGVPIHRSRDLVSWELVGNALTTDEQLDVSDSPASLGVCAPTLRHHDGRFWLITTNNHHIEQGHTIVHAEHAEGPWSPPVFTAGTIGIDPDLAWDDDGQAVMTWTSFDSRWFGIVQARVDLTTGEIGETPRQLWSGTGLSSPEGPHVFRRGDFWYLLVAEGGTQSGHGVSIARSRSIEGPFESGPANPILTHRSTEHPVQNTGHADMVELPDGTWAMVYLGVRPRGGGAGFHVNGRETFLAGIEWHDGWPTVIEDAFTPAPVDTSIDDHFAQSLAPHWISPRVNLATFTAPAADGGFDVSAAPGNAAVLTRTRDEYWEATVRMSVPSGASARLIVRLDDSHWTGIDVADGAAVARQQIGAHVVDLGEPHVVQSEVAAYVRAVPAPAGHPALQTNPDILVFGIIDGSGERHELGRAAGRYLATEVAGGFTGRTVGLQTLSRTVRLSHFTYTPLSQESA